MSKKSFWKFVAIMLIIAAAVAGCIIYLSKYKDFTKSLDEDFNDFEDEEADTEESDVDQSSSTKREYVSIPFEPSSAE